MTDIYLEFINIIDILIMRDRKLIRRISGAKISSSSTHALLVASGRDFAVLLCVTDGWEIAPPFFRSGGGGHILYAAAATLSWTRLQCTQVTFKKGDLEDLGRVEIVLGVPQAG